jgi:nicotinic acid mononucleotide adenylyltransferase
MVDNVQKMPFGYEPPVDELKGTIIYYDTFEHTTERELDLAADWVKARSFRKLVLYPLHELSIKRMSKEDVSPFYKREDRLHEWKRDRAETNIVVERFEIKRKKYTPIDFALRHLSETYPKPLFILMTGEMANLFASFSSFEEWIVKIRLLLTEEPAKLHPRLIQYQHRWEAIITK